MTDENFFRWIIAPMVLVALLVAIVFLLMPVYEECRAEHSASYCLLLVSG
jgi:hypothetical protein